MPLGLIRLRTNEMATTPRQMTPKELHNLLQKEYPPNEGESIPSTFVPKELLVDWPEDGKDGMIINTSIPNHRAIYNIARQLGQTETPIYQPCETKHNKRPSMQCMMPNLISALNQLARTRAIWSDDYCPVVNLFLETFDSLLTGIDRFDEPSRPYARPNADGETDPEKLINRTTFDLVTEFTERIRKEMRTSAFKRKEANWRGRAQRRMQAATAYIDGLFNTHSRLLVIRVDLYPERFKPNELTKNPQVGTLATTDQLDDLISKVERLLNNRRNNKLFEHCVGYIVKIEYAIDRGWHAHTIFFFDGHKVQNDSYYSTMIGDYWVDVITDGQGAFWACNRPSNISRYKQVGIGMIDHTDLEKRQALVEIVVAYLAKTDQHIQSKSFSGQKLFRTGRPAKPQDIKRGRPRLNS